MSFDEASFQRYLQQVPMFQACSEEELDAFGFLASPCTFDGGAAIVSEGDAGTSFYVLMSGRATVSRSGAPIASLAAGDYFGELALFDPSPRNATVTADGPVVVAELDRDRFQAALDAIPAIRDTLLRGMARRLHQLDARA
jgi:CRP-like cAMP-binding protein